MKTAWLSMGSSLEGWKYSATTSTGMARASASAPILVVIASSPPSCCRPLASRASIACSFPQRPDPKPTSGSHSCNDPTIGLWRWLAHPPNRPFQRLLERYWRVGASEETRTGHLPENQHPPAGGKRVGAG